MSNTGACPSRNDPYWAASGSYTAVCGNADEMTWGWMPAGVEPISGLVLLRELPTLAFLAAHDETSPGGLSLSVIEFENGLYVQRKPVALADVPGDIEGLIRLSDSRYSLITSAGTVLTFTLDTNETTATEIYRQGVAGYPWAGDSQIEGFALRKMWGHLVAIWATRGNGATPSRIFFGVMSEDGNVFTANYLSPPTYYSAPWPTPNQRHITGLHIDPAGIVYASSAVDPGDAGPFSSAVFRIGSFADAEPLPLFTLDGSPTELYRSNNHKIEAIAAMDDEEPHFGMVFGSDDEDFGGSVYLERAPIARTLTITRVAISYISEDDAMRKAVALAKTEALAELKCYFQGTNSARPYCDGNYYDPIVRTAWSDVSQEAAIEDAFAAAETAAEEWCETGFDQEPPPVINLGGENVDSLLIDEDDTPVFEEP